ncbi:hypothetical protein PWT90_02037 [Aphanocladium album]|nr:hypothetical protein PWT90_02037 [Aphanocladium album]
MTPLRRDRTGQASRGDATGNQVAAATRKSARLSEAVGATHSADRGISTGKKARSSLTAKPDKKASQAKQVYSMPTSPALDPCYVETKDRLNWPPPKLNPAEMDRVMQALSLILQAAVHLSSDLGGFPGSLDDHRDKIWDWRSIELSVKEYNACRHSIANYSMLSGAIEVVSYDWMPIDMSKGKLTVRKKCAFQSRLTRILDGVITRAMRGNKLLMPVIQGPALCPQIRASVRTGPVEGIRTPCRCWYYTPEVEDVKGEPRPAHDVVNFVLEVGVGDKTPELRALAESYIASGTLCVMTVKVERCGEHDIGWTYSLYRRGQARRSRGSATRYDVVCSAKDVKVEATEHSVAEFPVGLTVFDFLPAEVLEKNGVGGRELDETTLNLTMCSFDLDQTKLRLGGLEQTCKSMSEHLKAMRAALM